MLYTALTNQAIRIAYEAHQGQVDYNGIPYIFHPYHVAEQMEDEVTTCAALLHDVVEDTAVTLEELEEVFPEEVTEVVELLTHRQEEPYMDYIRRLSKHPAARAVKLADLAHNMDESRFAGNPDAVSEGKKQYWRQKYQEALEVLAD